MQVPELIDIPAGPFLMGSADGGDDERPEHVVALDAFSIGACPVTQTEYARFVEATGHRPPGLEGRVLPVLLRADRADAFRAAAEPYVWVDGRPPAGLEAHPVVLVTLEDAEAYCRWVSGRTGRLCRLPTEAEWEKAARGGRERQAFPWGDGIDLTHANFLPRVDQRAGRGTSPARSHAPNGYGLYGMAGNVWDWTSDWYQSDAYVAHAARNPTGPATGSLRVVRGGAWVNADVAYLRCACRHLVPPDTFTYSIGFRIVCRDR